VGSNAAARYRYRVGIEESRHPHRSPDVEHQSEWDLIVRCRGGSASAFEPFVRSHERAALAFAEALLGDGDEAADAVQDSFVRAYRSLSKLSPGSAFGPWFRAILRNRCLDRLRSAPARRQVTLDERAVDGTAWTEPVGTARLEHAEVSEAVRSALARLSAEHREVLVLKELEGLSYAGIAAATGVPPGTVASRLHHARSALKKAVMAGGLILEGGA
jgi:RNA polymerase sigma-70 factor, ECF subfamily